MLKELKQISHSIKESNPYWQYGFDIYEKPDGSYGEYHYVHSRGSVMIVPRFEDDTFLLTKQYRYLNQRVSIEFPGGGQLPDLSIEEQAQRELQEETGFSGVLHFLGVFNPCNGITNELSAVFLATDLKPVLNIRHDDSEEFIRLRLCRSEITALIRSNELWDGMTLAAWQMFLVSDAN
ncbi:MAG: NUDIX hydrolase [Bacteroidota bacterium]|nr:NUDIX hydrolase [Candidatus Kapabacteria bacterium]MDW8220780.1 NUDIX hydrolase [Bacteroidota bacterium]